MYAVVATGGKQYRVGAGDEIRVEKLDGEVGETVQLRPVMIVDDAEITAGPDLDGATLEATITEHGKGDKITVFTYKNKTRQHKKRGHRQPYTSIRFDSVELR